MGFVFAHLDLQNVMINVFYVVKFSTVVPTVQIRSVLYAMLVSTVSRNLIQTEIVSARMDIFKKVMFV
jgi:hypothetical protein